MTENRRVMIVEDEEGLAVHLSYLLKRNNFIPVGAFAYGEQAVEKAAALKPDLVLMDINLAGQMDGIEAARIIRDRINAPVIFLSALSEDVTLHEAQGSSPFAYLVKPVKEADLRAAIEVALYKHRMETRLRESEERYRLLFEKTSDGFGLGEIICDERGVPVDYCFLAINPAFERITGVSASNLVGHTLIEALPNFDGRYLIQRFGRVALTGEPAHFEFELKRSGHLLSITAYCPKPGQFATMVEDVTERRRAEEKLHDSYVRLEKSLRRMTILRNIDQAITVHTDQPVMAEAILSNIVEPGEIDGAVLFVPNIQPSGRLRSTGPLGMLRLAGLAGLPEARLDSSVLNWLTTVATQAFAACQPVFISDLEEEDHPGAQALHSSAGFNACAVLPLLARGQAKGVLQFFHHQQVFADLDWQTFLQSLALQSAIGMDHVEMLENLKRSNRELSSAYDETIKGWAQALELRDQETRGHAERVPGLTVRLASAMGFKGDALDHIRRGAFLHDVGKMAIPDRILRNTGPLTPDEWVTMRQHTTIAYTMLYNIDFLRPALDVVYAHHEKWDGSGYPRGLKGEEIPLSARIFAVVDVWDALTTDRPYRLAWPAYEAKTYIINQSGKHFDPHVVEEFLKLIP